MVCFIHWSGFIYDHTWVDVLDSGWHLIIGKNTSNQLAYRRSHMSLLSEQPVIYYTTNFPSENFQIRVIPLSRYNRYNHSMIIIYNHHNFILIISMKYFSNTKPDETIANLVSQPRNRHMKYLSFFICGRDLFGFCFSVSKTSYLFSQEWWFFWQISLLLSYVNWVCCGL